MSSVSKVEREARKLLRESGLPHDFRKGRHHLKVYVSGQLAMVMSHYNNTGDCKLLQTIIKKLKAAPCN